MITQDPTLPPGCNELPGESKEEMERQRLGEEFDHLSLDRKLDLIEQYIDSQRFMNYTIGLLREDTKNILPESNLIKTIDYFNDDIREQYIENNMTYEPY
jgi:hypothetical protein